MHYLPRLLKHAVVGTLNLYCAMVCNVWKICVRTSLLNREGQQERT